MDHISLNFKDQFVLQDVSMHIAVNELVGFSGKSGCGKSSLLKALLGFVAPAKGQIIIDGVVLNPDTIENIRKKMAYLPQDLNFPVATVRDMVLLPFGLRANRQVEFSEEKLFFFWDMLHLEHKLYNRKINKISGGQRQRVLLSVLAMLQKPICLIDEPTSALDEEGTMCVANLLQYLKQQGSTQIVVSHDSCLLKQCDRTIYF